MKVKELILRNYKGFGPDAAPISFCDELGNVNEVTVIIGKNASGKSSILQAIAFLAASAIRPKYRPSKLDWPGFGYDSIESGKLGIHASCVLQFSDEEIKATKELAEAIKDRIPNYNPPREDGEITLYLDYHEDSVRTKPAKSLSQAKGYQYALQQPANERGAALSRVGKIHFFHEQRTSSSILARAFDEDGHLVHVSDNDLRTILGKWSNLHYRRNGSQSSTIDDPFAELNLWFGKLFPGKSLVGSAPKRNPAQVLEAEDFWIKDERTGSEYELANMSGAERAIFPILLDFVNWDINNSIVIIDEVELHLHPPLQQALIKVLPMLGKNNQFIITTHSPHVLSMVHPEQVIVLKDFSAHRLDRNTLGRDSNSILNEVFGITERPHEYAVKLNRFYDSLDKRDEATATLIFEELQKDWGGNDLEIVKAEWRLMDLKSELDSNATH